MDIVRERTRDLVQVSLSALLEQQVDSGAFRASPDFSQYGYCWLRDGSFTAFALDRAGEHAAAAAFHSWVRDALDRIGPAMERCIEQRDAGRRGDAGELPPARFALDGAVVADDWPNFQIDGYGTWLWSLREYLARTGARPLPDDWRTTVHRVARYLAAFAFTPCFDVWEMDGDGVHTSTLGSVFAGLRAAGAMLGDAVHARAAEEVRAAVHASAAPGRPLRRSTLSADVDASILWLGAPFELLAPRDPVLTTTVAAIEADLGFEGGLRRFPEDTYFGGGAWPVLVASLGWHHLTVGDVAAAARCLEWVQAHIDPAGRLGEQFGGERRDAGMYREWCDRWGPPAQDLVWSHAMHLILAAELATRDDVAVAEHSSAPYEHAATSGHVTPPRQSTRKEVSDGE